jgi:hypothetical protein
MADGVRVPLIAEADEAQFRAEAQRAASAQPVKTRIEFDSAGSDIGKLGKNVDAITGKMGKLRQEAELFNRSLQSRGADQFLGKLGQTGAQLQKVGGFLGQTGGQLGQFSSAITRAGSSLTGLASPVAAVGAGLAAGATAAVLFGTAATKAFLGSVDSAKQLSVITGTSVRDASRIKEAYDDVGVSADKLTAPLQKLTKGLGSAEFQKLGIDATNSKEALLQVADAYEKAGSSGDRARIAATAFGRGNADALKLIERGRADINKLFAGNENLVVNPEDVAKTRKFRESLDGLGDTIQGSLISAGREIVPVLTSVVNTITPVVSGFLTAGKAVLGFVADIGQGVKAVGDFLAKTAGFDSAIEGIKRFGDVAGTVFEKVGAGIRGLRDLSQTVGNALGGNGLQTNAQLDAQDRSNAKAALDRTGALGANSGLSDRERQAGIRDLIKQVQDLGPVSSESEAKLRQLEASVKDAGPSYNGLTAEVKELRRAQEDAEPVLNDIIGLHVSGSQSVAELAAGYRDGSVSADDFTAAIVRQQQAQVELIDAKKKAAELEKDIVKQRKDIVTLVAGGTTSEILTKQANSIGADRAVIDARRNIVTSANNVVKAERALRDERALAPRLAQATADAEEALFRARREAGRASQVLAQQELATRRAGTAISDARVGLTDAQQTRARAIEDQAILQRSQPLEAARRTAEDAANVTNQANEAAFESEKAAFDQAQKNRELAKTGIEDRINVLNEQISADKEAADAKKLLVTQIVAQRDAQLALLDSLKDLNNLGFNQDGNAVQAILARAESAREKGRSTTTTAGPAGKSSAELQIETLKTELERLDKNPDAPKQAAAVKAEKTAAELLLERDKVAIGNRRALEDADRKIRDADTGIRDSTIAIADAITTQRDQQQKLDDLRRDQSIDVAKSLRDGEQAVADAKKAERDEAFKLIDLQTALDDSRIAYTRSTEDLTKQTLLYKASIEAAKEAEAKRFDLIQEKTEALIKKQGELDLINASLFRISLIASGQISPTAFQDADAAAQAKSAQSQGDLFRRSAKGAQAIDAGKQLAEGFGNITGKVKGLFTPGTGPVGPPSAFTTPQTGGAIGPPEAAPGLFDKIVTDVSKASNALKTKPLDIPVVFSASQAAQSGLLNALTLAGTKPVTAPPTGPVGPRPAYAGGEFRAGETGLVNEFRNEYAMNRNGINRIPGGPQIMRFGADTTILPNQAAAIAAGMGGGTVASGKQVVIQGDVNIGTNASTNEGIAANLNAILHSLSGV